MEELCQSILPSVHHHNATTRIESTAVQACVGQFPVVPACHFPAVAAFNLGLVHVWPARVRQPFPEWQLVRCVTS